jgi:predicted secreted protein
MSWTTAIAIYFLIWWVVLFAVLPWGVRAQGEEGGEIPAGTDPGAPAIPALGRKLVWTTAVTTVVFAVCYVAYTRQYVTFDGVLRLIGMPR